MGNGKGETHRTAGHVCSERVISYKWMLLLCCAVFLLLVGAVFCCSGGVGERPLSLLPLCYFCMLLRVWCENRPNMEFGARCVRGNTCYVQRGMDHQDQHQVPSSKMSSNLAPSVESDFIRFDNAQLAFVPK